MPNSLESKLKYQTTINKKLREEIKELERKNEILTSNLYYADSWKSTFRELVKAASED
jgi:hypothetical protein